MADDSDGIKHHLRVIESLLNRNHSEVRGWFLDLNNRLDTQRTAITALRSEVQALGTQASAINNRLAEIEADIGIVNDNLAQIGARLDLILARTPDIEADKATIETTPPNER